VVGPLLTIEATFEGPPSLSINSETDLIGSKLRRMRSVVNAYCVTHFAKVVGMALDSPGKRLIWSRERHGKHKTATEAARAYGWTVPTYLGHENGDRNPSRGAAKMYAKRYGVRWEWLLDGEGPAAPKRRVASAAGYVGAGAEVIPVDDHAPGAGLEEAEIPAGVPDDAVLVIVRGDSMYPRYFDNEYLFYHRDQRSPSEFIGRECVVALEDGRIYVKVLRKGANGFFNLESWNAPTLENKAVQWAAPVLARVNRGGR
jgi:transcriptional regulator with XRE-family HTH domain